VIASFLFHLVAKRSYSKDWRSDCIADDKTESRHRQECDQLKEKYWRDILVLFDFLLNITDL